MKRILQLIILFSVFAGCSRDEANSQQHAAQTKFESAFKLREQGEKGISDKPFADTPEISQLRSKYGLNITAEPYGKSRLEYRQEKQAEAAAELQQLAQGGRPAQASAANSLIAEANASAARFALRDASLAWAAQSTLASHLVDGAGAIRLNTQLAGLYGKVSYDEQISQTRKLIAEQTAIKADLEQSVRKISEEIQALEAEIKQHADEQTAKSQEADELARKAFVSKGRLQYDLYVQSVNLAKEADSHSALSEIVKAKLSIAKASLQVEQARLAAATTQIKTLGDAVEALTQRAAQSGKLAADAQKLVQTLGTGRDYTSQDGEAKHDPGFDDHFQALAKAQAELIEASFDRAVTAMGEAISAAENATSGAPQTARTLAEISHWVYVAELGHVYRERASVNVAYGHLLKSLVDTLSEADAKRAAMVDEATAPTAQRVQESQDKAKENLAKAAEEFEKLAESSQSGNDPATERIVRRQLAAIYLSTAAVTGDESFNAKADAEIQRIGQIKAKE